MLSMTPGAGKKYRQLIRKVDITSSVPMNGTEPLPPAMLMPSPVPGALTILITLGAGDVTGGGGGGGGGLVVGEMRLALKSEDKMSTGEFA